MGTQVDRRDRTSIKIEILRTLYQKKKLAKDSKYFGSLSNIISTNPDTFNSALEDLISKGLVEVQTVEFRNKKVTVFTLTEEGKTLVPPSLKLL